MAEGQWDSATGVCKYFFLVKEEVSSDWKDLAFHLDFRRSDIDNIEGRNRDDKSRCMDLLEEWLKRNGERATIEVLMEALSEAELQSTVDGLKNKYPELKTPQALSSQQDIEDVFRKAVKKYYELNLASFKPLIWNGNFTLNLGDIFTQLELVPKDQKQPKRSEGDYRSGEIKQINSLDDLFNPGVTGLPKAPRCILIEGVAGGGKTTFLSKEALDAVSKKTEMGRRHDIIVLIRLREVRAGETIEEMVWDQCVPECLEGQSIRAILQRNESRVLFLLDGYDELRPEAKAARQAIPKLLSGKFFLNSTIVVTSRPSAGVQQYTRPDCHVHIKGFSSEHMKRYVQQYFSITGNPEKAEHLMAVLDKRLLVTDLIHTPIFLLMVCVLWEEDQEMVSTGTMTGLYNNLLTCLIRKLCKREGVEMPTGGLIFEDYHETVSSGICKCFMVCWGNHRNAETTYIPTEGLLNDLAASLFSLGKLALEALLRNETLIDLTQIEKGEILNWELLLKLGVVSLENSTSKCHARKQLNFSHKTMQEFLAGRYVAQAVVNLKIVKLLQVMSISKALELSNLLQFTCGCNPRLAQVVMEELGKLSSKEFSHLRPSDFHESHMPVKSDTQRSAENYKEFVLLCLDILNERKEPPLLQAVSKALPFIFIDFRGHDKQSTALKYYLENIRSSNLQHKVILNLRDKDAFPYFEQILNSPILGIQLDLKLRYFDEFPSSNQTVKLFSGLKNVPSLRALQYKPMLPSLDTATGLTSALLQLLVQAFVNVSLLEELDLSNNSSLGDAGMKVLQSGLSSVPRLAVLRLGRVGMTAVGMKSMAPYMRHLAALKELDIGDNKIGDTGLESLIPVLSILSAMQVLVLSGTRISATGMRTLVPALCQLSRLIKLDISKNHGIRDLGLKFLADILPRLTAMKVLDLNLTRISDIGISFLTKALPDLVQLQVLDVSWNDIGDSGIVSLVQKLCQLSSSDMKQNPPGDKSLNTAPHCNTTLQELNIGWNDGVTGARLGTVSQLISALPALTRLDMSAVVYQPAHLSDTAAMALAEALPRLPALEGLGLQYISMEPAGFRAVVQAAEEHPTLEILWFSKDRVPEGADTSTSCLGLL